MDGEILKLLNDILSYIKFIKSKAVFVEDLTNKLGKNIMVVREQIEVYLTSQRANLPRSILQNFPDVKARVLSNLNGLINEELSELTGYMIQLCQLQADLRKIYDKIEKWMSKINWNEYLPYFSAFSCLTEWAEKCWKYFYFIYVNLENGLRSIKMANTNYKSLQFMDTVDGVNKRYIFENPITDLFQMLKLDFSSRSKVNVLTSATV